MKRDEVKVLRVRGGGVAKTDVKFGRADYK